MDLDKNKRGYELTQHRGFYCGYCEVRYVAHVCKERLPCMHPKRDAFFVFRWDYHKGYKRFHVSNEEHGILFDVRHVDYDQLDEAIIKYTEWLNWQVVHDNIWLFVKGKNPIEVFHEACESAGGVGRDFPPKWRIKELQKAYRLSSKTNVW